MNLNLIIHCNCCLIVMFDMSTNNSSFALSGESVNFVFSECMKHADSKKQCWQNSRLLIPIVRLRKKNCLFAQK